MWIELNFLEDRAIIRKEPKDKKVYSDSALFYKIKKALQALNFDCIKKLMVKDGHMVSEGIYYVRDRKGEWALWNPNYQVRSAYQDFNKGKVVLRLE